MSTTTRCPTCNTLFKVSEEQLDAYNGLVRCGRCQSVFDAGEYLQDDKPSPQLDLPIPPVAPGARETVQQEFPAPPPVSAAITQAHRITFANIPDDEIAPPPAKKPIWPVVAVNVVLSFILLGQCAYFFRVQLAASMPGLKPALVASCRFFRCTVPLPRQLEQMSIESSELEADPAQPGIITLNAILRNQARFAQAFPNLELTLTDETNRPLARRSFIPAEYLGPGNDEQRGLPASRELGIRLNIDTSDLKPSGYKLFIY